MKAFKDKKRYSLLQIIVRIIFVDFLFFLNLFINRIVFGGTLQEDAENGLALYFFLYFLAALVLIVLGGFATRLIDEKRKRILKVFGKVDWYYKMLAFVALLFVVYTTDNDKYVAIVYIVLAFAIILSFALVVYVYYKKQNKTVIVDWSDWFRIKDATSEHNFVELLKNKKLVLLYIVDVIAMVFMVVFSNNDIVRDAVYGMLLLSLFSVMYFILTVLMLIKFVDFGILNMSSLIFGIGVSFVGYFASANFGVWTMFFLGFFVVNYPLLNAKRKIAKLLFFEEE